jgi:hypothetical protein
MRVITIAFTVVVASAVLGIAAAGANAAVLSADPATINFGLRPVGSENFAGTTITNVSGSAVQVLVDSHLPDDFGFGLMPGSTCPVLAPGTLGPGESCDAVVRYSPSEFFAGQPQTGSLTATATDASGSVVDQLEIPVTGTGTLAPLTRNALRVDPKRLNWGRQTFETSVKRTVTMTNTSQRTLYLTIDAFVPDTFSPGQPESTCSLSFMTNILSPGQSCTHVVSFDPHSAFLGRQTGELVIRASDGFGNQLPDVHVKLSGTGTP